MAKDSLSRERIIDAAIELLDAEGEDGLTFRALAVRLSTGAGALYWHVENKGELFAASSAAVIARALAEVPRATVPHKAIRAIAAGVFEAIDAHPWVGAQLSREPWGSALLQLFEQLGRQVQALGVTRRLQFTFTSTLLSYIIGVSSQNALNARLVDPATNRVDFLESVWSELDTHEYPFARSVVAQVRAHDDRKEFLAGIEVILAGITASLK